MNPGDVVNGADKRALKETEIRTRYITPAIVRAGWDPDKNQVREEYTIAPGKIVVRGKLHSRESAKSVDAGPIPGRWRRLKSRPRGHGYCAV
ncbi:hypothetical protein, partial [Mycobacterium sp. 1274756.6]|uniref:hypothetical protein n=1 Tax=Mycobacterium sp. 1274756.6 TaxID=1834076 RepID=UPI001E508F9A